MTKVTYLPRVTEEPPPPSTATQWSFGIAMFAAFVLPFVLLVTSSHYRGFVDRAYYKFEAFRGTSGAGSKLPPVTPVKNH